MAFSIAMFDYQRVEHVSDEDTFLYVIRIYNRETLESCLQLDYLT
jgi:hypothetical protein